VPFDLAEVTERVLAGRQDEASRSDVRIEASLAPAIVTGDPDLAESLVANLVGNAIRHNVAGGHAGVAVSVQAGRPCLSVSNSGPVIPPGEVSALLEPFRQLGGERTRRGGGHGLGLAIVAAVASAHDAGLAIAARPEGGLEVTVTFRR
jgi:signal transduction histidine kinase